MTAKEVLAALEAALGDRLREQEIRARSVGVKSPRAIEEVWGRIDRETLVQAAGALRELGPLHFSIISGADLGEEIELLYHFAVGFGTPEGEIMVTLRLAVPKADLTVPSLCGVIAGAETTEREKIEFLGLDFTGIPDRRHLFLPEDMQIHPWRKDEPELAARVKRAVKWEDRDAGAE
ncbi:MAG: NADH-quinone oxidoreductase subunit C [Candidatus Bipolaricaulaceae bacterium]